MLVEYVKDNYNARFHYPTYHRDRKTHFIILLNIFLTKSMEHEIYVKVTQSWCALVEYVKDNS